MNKKLINEFIETFSEDFNHKTVKDFLKKNKIDVGNGDDVFNLIAKELKNYSEELLPKNYHNLKDYNKDVKEFKSMKKSLLNLEKNDIFGENDLLDNVLKKDVNNSSFVENFTDTMEKINDEYFDKINSLDTKKNRNKNKTTKNIKKRKENKINETLDETLKNLTTDDMTEDEIEKVKDFLNDIKNKNNETYYDSKYENFKEKYKDLDKESIKKEKNKYSQDELFHDAETRNKAKMLIEQEEKEAKEQAIKKKSKKTRKEKKTIKNEKKLTKEIAKESGSKLTFGTAMTYGLAAWGGVSTYKQAKEEGDSTLVAGVKGVFDATVVSAMPMSVFAATQLIPAVPKLTVKGLSAMQRYQREMSRQQRNTPFVNNHFVDHAGAVTMRQAGMQLAEASRYNLQQSMLGNEASMLKK